MVYREILQLLMTKCLFIIFFDRVIGVEEVVRTGEADSLGVMAIEDPHRITSSHHHQMYNKRLK